jgi:hypothetical protein
LITDATGSSETPLSNVSGLSTPLLSGISQRSGFGGGGDVWTVVGMLLLIVEEHRPK